MYCLKGKEQERKKEGQGPNLGKQKPGLSETEVMQ